MQTQFVFDNCLLVEDDAAHAKLIGRSIAPLVPHLTVANDFLAGLAAYETLKPDLVLCDLKLPGGSGIDLIAQLRAGDPLLPIVVLTSSDNFQHAVDAMQAGAWDYLVKNFNEDFLPKLTVTLRKVKDLLDRKLAEAGLLEERNAFWSAAQSASEGLAITNHAGEIIFANHFFDSFTNLLLHEDPQGSRITPRSLASVIEAVDSQAAKRLSEHLHSSSNPPLWSTELRLKKEVFPTLPADKHFQLTITQPTALVSPASGTSNSGIVVWIQDITEKKLKEKFQRDLLATTVHDLKGPLGAITTAVELLSDQAVANKQEPHTLLVRIASCARGALTLIDELLSATKIQESMMVIKPAWCSLPTLITSVIDDFSPVSQSREVAVNFDASTCPTRVFADKTALRRVITNLVSNGIKFTKPGGSVSISACAEESQILINIKDTGTGIDPNQRHALFERFQRLDMHAQVEGTGLGLFVVRNIIDAHNGTIELSSELGVGSSFTIALPLPQDDRGLC